MAALKRFLSSVSLLMAYYIGCIEKVSQYCVFWDGFVNWFSLQMPWHNSYSNIVYQHCVHDLENPSFPDPFLLWPYIDSASQISIGPSVILIRLSVIAQKMYLNDIKLFSPRTRSWYLMNHNTKLVRKSRPLFYSILSHNHKACIITALKQPLR